MAGVVRLLMGESTATVKLQTVDKKIYEILRTNLDTPRVVFFTAEPVFLYRHSDQKRVVLVSTTHYTYLIKQKGYKLYHRWLNRELSAEASGADLTVRSAPANTSAALGGPIGSTDVQQADTDDSFKTALLNAGSMLQAKDIQSKLNNLAHNAQRAAALQAVDELGPAIVGPRHASSTADMDKDGDDDAIDSSGSDLGDDDLGRAGGLPSGTGGLDAARKPGSAKDGQQGLLRIAPSRYIAITSLVDGEFADYTTLKTAYLRHEEEDLLKDLATVIRENEGQVEALCEHHYPAFIHAAQQCLAISEKDAQLVGEELGGATALVRSSVVDMKQMAASLILSRSTHENLVHVRALLSRAIAVVEYLETAEAQVQQQQLIGAIASLRELVRLSAPLAEYALGEYVLQVRVPALTQDTFSYAVQHLNAWLKLLRDQANGIGQAALDWAGRVAPGSVTKHISTAPSEGAWWISESFQPAALKLTAYQQGEAVSAVSNGAAVQGVFIQLRREEYFVRYYTEGRAQQSRADIFEATLAVADVPAEELVASFEKYCASALGFMLIEDIVYHATNPHILSRSEILKTWDRVAAAVGERAKTVSDALKDSSKYALMMATMFVILRNLVQHATENVKCVELSPLSLSRVIEALSDNVVSWALQSACMETSQVIAAENFDPLTVNSAAQFEANASRFFLNACARLELPIPPSYTSGTVALPYSAVVPVIGSLVLQFLDQCYAVVATDGASAVRQSELNNVDEMLLKYISVLFRTVAESLNMQLIMMAQPSVLQFATFVSSASAMPVIVSCAEQKFMMSWLGGDGSNERQSLGTPKLLAESAGFFSKPIQNGIERLLQAYMGELEVRLRPMANINYWKNLVEVRNGKQPAKKDADGGSECMAECMDYAIALIPKLTSILQKTVARSVVSTALAKACVHMQTNIQSAISDAYANGERDFVMLRDALKEFQSQCTLLIPQWQRRLAAVMSDLTAVKRFPLNVSSLVEDSTQWMDLKEAQYKVDRANQPQLLAGIEMTGKAVVTGFKAVGGAAAATANVFKRS